MTTQELVETALHALVAWTRGVQPASADVETLRREFPASADLPVDELACQAVHDLAGRAFPRPEQPQMEVTKTERVA